LDIDLACLAIQSHSDQYARIFDWLAPMQMSDIKEAAKPGLASCPMQAF
jgi:hypothetical protein